jgi:alpha-amylase
MKIAQAFTRLLFAASILTACLAAPAPETPTVQPSLTVPPSATATSTTAATDTPQPTETATPLPLPTIPSTPVQPVTGLPQGTDGYPWWNDAVFYEIFVRSFYDSDGDGVGDINGITEKLDYLNDGDPSTTTDLGVTGLWLMPIHPSPSYHGYDVMDYYDVNPEYGTLDDFKLLVEEAHKRGIRVTIDWVLNHTSSQHPWFEQAKDSTSSYRDWYRWTTEQFPGPGWRYGGGGASYYANFSEAMPDLNYANPAVRAEMKKVFDFWVNNVGIDGFRLDGAKHIFEDGQITENVPETHVWYKELRSYSKGVAPQALTVGEVADDSETVSTYIQGDELDLAFDFDLARTTVFSAGAGRADDVSDVLRKDLSLFQPGQFATFLTNHDQERTMSILNDDVEAAKNAAFLLLTSPGVPFLYYGEEIGMLGKKPDEDIRRPLQWSGEEDAGFTSGAPWRAPVSDYTTKNIAAQSEDPGSLLSLYRRLIHLRNEHAALRVGDHYFLETAHPAVYAGLRVSQEETILVLINLGSQPISDYALNLAEGPLSGEYLPAPLQEGGQFTSPIVTDLGGFENYRPVPEIPPYGRFIVQFQPQTK